jgi:hypothetical protein
MAAVGYDRGVAVTVPTSDGDQRTYPEQAKVARETAAMLGTLKVGKKRGSHAWRQIDRALVRERGKAAALVDNWARDTAADKAMITLEIGHSQ